MPVLVGFLDNVNGGVEFGYQQNGTSREAEKLDTEEAGGGRKIEREEQSKRFVTRGVAKARREVNIDSIVFLLLLD